MAMFKKPTQIIVLADKIASIFSKHAENNGILSKIDSIVEDNQHKKNFSDISINPLKGELSNFDWQVLTAAIAQQQAGNEYTSAAILYAAMGGNETHLTESKKKEILQSIERLMHTEFVYSINKTVLKEKTKWTEKGETKIVEGGIRSYLLPAEIVEEKINGQLTRDAIKFIKPSPLFEVAEFKNQLERIDAELLKVPQLNCTTATVNLRFELVNLIVRQRRMQKQRLQSAKRNKKRNKPVQVAEYLQINLANLFKRCGLSAAKEKHTKFRNHITKILNHFQKLGFITEWHFGKTGRAFTHIYFNVDNVTK